MFQIPQAHDHDTQSNDDGDPVGNLRRDDAGFTW